MIEKRCPKCGRWSEHFAYGHACDFCQYKPRKFTFLDGVIMVAFVVVLMSIFGVWK